MVALCADVVGFVITNVGGKSGVKCGFGNVSEKGAG